MEIFCGRVKSRIKTQGTPEVVRLTHRRSRRHTVSGFFPYLGQFGRENRRTFDVRAIKGNFIGKHVMSRIKGLNSVRL